MEALLLYQVKVAVLVAVLFGGYRLLLGRETFHRFNRSVLVSFPTTRSEPAMTSR